MQIAFEAIVKKHVVKGADIPTAWGRAIKESPESYCRYLRDDALADTDRKKGRLKA